MCQLYFRVAFKGFQFNGLSIFINILFGFMVLTVELSKLSQCQSIDFDCSVI